jgi:hypothetical protein
VQRITSLKMFIRVKRLAVVLAARMLPDQTLPRAAIIQIVQQAWCATTRHRRRLQKAATFRHAIGTRAQLFAPPLTAFLLDGARGSEQDHIKVTGSKAATRWFRLIKSFRCRLSRSGRITRNDRRKAA